MRATLTALLILSLATVAQADYTTREQRVVAETHRCMDDYNKNAQQHSSIDPVSMAIYCRKQAERTVR
jgi:hypothetical protein|nr:MAG TPA: hypothetical protein [Caudoviricetes sp.]DAN86787.1 MAG TPA: hypothetical protein [Caudoviricetes sp.]DAU19067.1 MAG TPA: hypothetical protein [Caudoviricetes sp.]